MGDELTWKRIFCFNVLQSALLCGAVCDNVWYSGSCQCRMYSFEQLKLFLVPYNPMIFCTSFSVEFYIDIILSQSPSLLKSLETYFIVSSSTMVKKFKAIFFEYKFAIYILFENIYRNNTFPIISIFDPYVP